MKIDSHIIEALLASEKIHHGAPVRLEFTAGWGCLVYEVFYRDKPTDYPIERILI